MTASITTATATSAAATSIRSARSSSTLQEIAAEREARTNQHDPVVLLAILEVDLLHCLGDNNSNNHFITKLRLRSSEVGNRDNGRHNFFCTVQQLQTRIRQHLAACSPRAAADSSFDQLDVAVYDPTLRDYVPLPSTTAAAAAPNNNPMGGDTGDDIVERFGTRLRIRVTERPSERSSSSSSRQPPPPLLAIQGRYYEFNGVMEVRTTATKKNETLRLTFAEAPNHHHNSSSDDGTGFNVWDGAILLARYLQHAASCVVGRRVLELGAGCGGVPGITAAALGARHVTLTDLPHVLPRLRSNVERNREAIRLAKASGGVATITTIECRACDWSQPLPREWLVPSPAKAEIGVSDSNSEEDGTASSSSPFDVILVADCVWMEHLVAPLLAVLKRLTDETMGHVIISYQRRGKATHDAFWQGLHDIFSRVEVLKPPHDFDMPDVFYLLSCRR